MKKQVYKYSGKNSRYAENYQFFICYTDGSANIFYLASNSLGNLKKEIKAMRLCNADYYAILTCYKDGVKQKRPVLVSLYKPKGIV
jgi:hypothetical protein